MISNTKSFLKSPNKKSEEFKVEALEASSSTLPPSQASYMGWIRTGGTRFRFFLPHMVAIRFIREAFKNVLADFVR